MVVSVCSAQHSALGSVYGCHCCYPAGPPRSWGRGGFRHDGIPAGIKANSSGLALATAQYLPPHVLAGGPWNGAIRTLCIKGDFVQLEENTKNSPHAASPEHGSQKRKVSLKRCYTSARTADFSTARRVECCLGQMLSAGLCCQSTGNLLAT